MNVNVIRSDVLRGLEITASLGNLFDQRYSEPVSEGHRQGGITQDGRRLLLAMTWRFR